MDRRKALCLSHTWWQSWDKIKPKDWYTVSKRIQMDPSGYWLKGDFDWKGSCEKQKDLSKSRGEDESSILVVSLQSSEFDWKYLNKTQRKASKFWGTINVVEIIFFTSFHISVEVKVSHRGFKQICIHAVCVCVFGLYKPGALCGGSLLLWCVI